MINCHERQGFLPNLQPIVNEAIVNAGNGRAVPDRSREADAAPTAPESQSSNFLASPWANPEIAATLDALALDRAMRPKDIAEELNRRFPNLEKPITRNAVIGRADRKGIVLLGAHQPRPETSATRKATGAKRDRSGPRRDAPAQARRAAGPPAPRETAQTRAAPSNPPVARLTETMRSNLRAGAAALVAIHQRISDDAEAEGRDLLAEPIKVTDLGDLTGGLFEETTIFHPATMPDNACQHPTAVMKRGRTHLFCGAPAERNKPYCKVHGRLCHST